METTVKNYKGNVEVFQNETYRNYVYSDDYKCFDNREEYINYLINECDFSEDVANQIADYAENSVNNNFYLD